MIYLLVSVIILLIYFFNNVASIYAFFKKTHQQLMPVYLLLGESTHRAGLTQRRNGMRRMIKYKLVVNQSLALIAT